MTTIDEFVVSWRVDDGYRGTEPADLLATLISADLERELDAALAGRDPEELVAIDRVRVPDIVIDSGLPWTVAVADWARGVALSVRAAADADAASGPAAGGTSGPAAHGTTVPPPRVVRYPHRSAAVLVLLRRWSAGDDRQAWSWPLLGLGGDGRTTPPTPAVVTALASVPGQLPAILSMLASEGTLGRIVNRFGTRAIVELAAAAWAALGAAPPFGAGPDAGRDAGHPPQSAHPSPVFTGALARMVTATGSGGLDVEQLSRQSRRALAALAVAAEAPAAVAGGAGARLVASLLGVTSDPAGVDPAAGCEPAAVTSTADVDDLDAGEVGRRALATDSTAGMTSSAPHPGPAAGDAEAAGARASDVARADVDGRRRAWTENAGLLFLLHVVHPDTHLPAVFGRRSALHALGAELLSRADPAGAPPAPHDPALLAFCGLGSDADPPGTVDASPSDPRAAESAIGLAAEGMLGRLLDRWREPASDADDVLRRVIRRRGAVLCDPGWIDVELDIDEVDVAIRAAGLDLDPGWLPLIGVVVRFRYV